MSLAKLKDAFKNKELTYGEKSVLKKVRSGSVTVVFMAKNCKPSLRESLEHYATVGNFELIALDIPASEIGSVCKKQFSVGVLCY